MMGSMRTSRSRSSRSGRRRIGRRRAGFTLLELIVALVLTAVAVTIAGSALRTASTAGERVAQHRATLERDARLRTMLTDMLRHAPSAESVDEPLLSIVPAAGTSTRTTSQLVFLTKGVRAPFGTGSTWRVVLGVTDEGLVLEAAPIGSTRDASMLRAVQPGVTAMSVRVLEQSVPGAGGRSAAWRSDWPLAQARPAMIALDFDGTDDLPPLILALDPLSTMAVRR